MSARTESDPWMNASNALRHLTDLSDSEEAAKTQLLQRLSDSLVKSIASVVVRESIFGPVSDSPPKATSGRVIQIHRANRRLIKLGAGFWSDIRGCPEAQMQCKWYENTFVFIEYNAVVGKVDRNTGEIWFKPGVRHVAYGVCFSSTDIENILYLMERQPRKEKTKHNSIKKPYPDAVERIKRRSELKGMMQSAMQGHLIETIFPNFQDFDQYGAQAKLEKLIMELYTDTENMPSGSTIRRYAKDLIDIHKQATADGSGPVEPR